MADDTTADQNLAPNAEVRVEVPVQIIRQLAAQLQQLYDRRPSLPDDPDDVHTEYRQLSALASTLGERLKALYDGMPPDYQGATLPPMEYLQKVASKCCQEKRAKPGVPMRRPTPAPAPIPQTEQKVHPSIEEARKKAIARAKEAQAP